MKTCNFYITGESYAGHYIPAFDARVHHGNKAKEGIYISLKGFAIGNGLTDPAIRYKAFTDYALYMGIIKKADCKRINRVLRVFETAIKLYGSLCYDFSNMEKFLNQENVRDALGVGDIDFASCNPIVYQAMLVDWMRNLEAGIPALLEDWIKLLVYAREYDLICNLLGNSRWVHAMEWTGKENFVASEEPSFDVDGSEAGVLKSYGPSYFLKVHDAGNMVPMDQPKAALEMLKRWTRGSLSAFIAKPYDDMISSI